MLRIQRAWIPVGLTATALLVVDGCEKSASKSSSDGASNGRSRERGRWFGYPAGFTGFGGSEGMPTSTSSLDRFVRASMLARTTASTSIPDSAFTVLESLSKSFWFRQLELAEQWDTLAE